MTTIDTLVVTLRRSAEQADFYLARLMRDAANTLEAAGQRADELADQILDIIERHIRMDPDDEGDPGEAARRIIEDIIVPIEEGARK